jgi:hypothetical protein
MKGTAIASCSKVLIFAEGSCCYDGKWIKSHQCHTLNRLVDQTLYDAWQRHFVEFDVTASWLLESAGADSDIASPFLLWVEYGSGFC